MAKNIQGLLRAVIFDPATGDKVDLRLFSPESAVPVEPRQTETADGAIFGGRFRNIELVFFDLPTGARARLEGWENASTPIQMVALTATGVLFVLEEMPVTGFVDSLNVNARDGVSPYRVAINIEHWPHFVHYGQNFLKAVCKQRSDNRTQTDATALFIPKVRIGGLGRLVLDEFAAPEGEAVQLKFPFPIPGVQIFVQGDTNAGPSSIAVRQLNFAGTDIGSPTGVPTTGTVVPITTDANIFSLQFDLPADDVSRIQASIRNIPFTTE